MANTSWARPRRLRGSPAAVTAGLLLVVWLLHLVVGGRWFSSLALYGHAGGSGSEHGFQYVIPVPSRVIVPDLSNLAQYRTAQRIYIDQRAVPSRQVLFTCGAPSPRYVVVMGLNSDQSERHLSLLLADKVAYAEAHGYGVFVRYLQDTAVRGVPVSDALGIGKLVLLRQAMRAFPQAEWFWLVDQNSVIMQPERPIFAITPPKTLESLLLRGVPLTPKQPHIKSYRNLAASSVAFVAARDADGLSPRSMLVKNTMAGRAFLEYATDPLNQNHAPFQSDVSSPSQLLTHITVWHPRFMANIGVVAARVLGSTSPSTGDLEMSFKPGDFLYLLRPSTSNEDLMQQWRDAARLRARLRASASAGLG